MTAVLLKLIECFLCHAAQCQRNHALKFIQNMFKVKCSAQQTVVTSGNKLSLEPSWFSSLWHCVSLQRVSLLLFSCYFCLRLLWLLLLFFVRLCRYAGFTVFFYPNHDHISFHKWCYLLKRSTRRTSMNKWRFSCQKRWWVFVDLVELPEAVFDQSRTTLQELVAAAGQRQGLTWKTSDFIDFTAWPKFLGFRYQLSSISRTFFHFFHLPFRHFVQDGQQTPNITGEIHVMTRWLPAEMKQAS